MIRRTAADALPSFEPKVADGIFMAWNMEVIQGADVLIYQAGKPVITTVSAPKPWPTHIIPTRQRWRVFSGPKGVNLWMGDQGGMVWGERTKQIEEELVTFEERREMSPYDRNASCTTQIDLLVKELMAKKKSEDVSTYAQFFPGIITEEEIADQDEDKSEGAEPGDAPEEGQDSIEVKETPIITKELPQMDDDKQIEVIENDLEKDQPKSS